MIVAEDSETTPSCEKVLSRRPISLDFRILMKKKIQNTILLTFFLAGGVLITAGGKAVFAGDNGDLFNGLGLAYINLINSYDHWQEGAISRGEYRRERSLAISLLRKTLIPNRIVYGGEQCYFTKPRADSGNVLSLSCLNAGTVDEASGILFMFFDHNDRQIAQSNKTAPEIIKKVGKARRIAGAVQIIAMTEAEASPFGPDFYGTFIATNKSLRIFCRIIDARP